MMGRLHVNGATNLLDDDDDEDDVADDDTILYLAFFIMMSEYTRTYRGWNQKKKNNNNKHTAIRQMLFLFACLCDEYIAQSIVFIHAKRFNRTAWILYRILHTLTLKAGAK